MNNSEPSSHTESIFDTQGMIVRPTVLETLNWTCFSKTDDHLVSDLYRGSITAVPSAHDTDLYAWGCLNQTDWAVLDWRERRWRAIEAVCTGCGFFRISLSNFGPLKAKNDNGPGTRHAHSATYFTMLGEAYIAILGGFKSSQVCPLLTIPSYRWHY